MTQEKKSYALITFVNCDYNFDYTICEWQDVDEYAREVQRQAEDLDEKGFNSWNEKLQLPMVTIAVTMMTPDEFSKWFEENVESRA